MSAPLVDIQDLKVVFDTDDGVVTAVDSVGFSVMENEVLGLVGESGCGKSVTAMSILSLIPSPPGRLVSGKVIYQGRDLLSLSREKLRQVRGNRISMIFQDPMTALSPLHRVGAQLAEALLVHGRAGKKEAMAQAEAWLGKMGIPDPKETSLAYPYELSGGMQQRVMIAMAMMLDPHLIIADEPTTALDVTTSAQIFELLSEMRKDKTSILLITHDLGVIWETCDRVLVMYAGKIVEQAPVKDLFNTPAHPYTRELLKSMPTIDGGELYAISGQVPSALNFPAGCRFNDRCPDAFDRCRREQPPLMDLGGGRRSACFLAKEFVP
ncbi:MAG: ABC transporter ATP-binding protein [Deltaproteobacteria bacterium]|nr:ABC transporter ATP-binding protein [Deltaproteobacteria bacterium]